MVLTLVAAWHIIIKKSKTTLMSSKKNKKFFFGKCIPREKTKINTGPLCVKLAKRFTLQNNE